MKAQRELYLKDANLDQLRSELIRVNKSIKSYYSLKRCFIPEDLQYKNALLKKELKLMVNETTKLRSENLN